MFRYDAFSAMLGRGFGQINTPRRKVFISYHHKNDQGWYNDFSKCFSEELSLFYDNSLERELDSSNAVYLNRKVREEYIFGTSLTIVLCGAETYKRRWVDWEIHDTLHHQHGLLGIALPSCARGHASNAYRVPNRFLENYHSGYALWMRWTTNAALLKAKIEEAVKNSSQTSLIRNSNPKMKRSLP